jgi:membrane-bound metal-dependent hydrolase YbcI (DUF457 family)
MASYRGHLAFASALGAAYAGVGLYRWDLDWGPVFLGAGLTTLGGLLPDLDSDSGVPVRELFSAAAAITPLLLFDRLRADGLTLEQTLALLGGVYLFIRYALAALFKRWTVHRGMFHSLPALFICGLAVFLLYHTRDPRLRFFLAGGVMLGFLSHLVLDVLYSVDLMGAHLRLKNGAGSPLKLFSTSWPATAATYAALGGLAWLAWQDPDFRRAAEGLYAAAAASRP